MSLHGLWLQVCNGRFRWLCSLKIFRLKRFPALKRPISTGTAHMQAPSLCLVVAWCDTVFFLTDKHAATVFRYLCGIGRGEGAWSRINIVPKLELALVSLHWGNWFIAFIPVNSFTSQFPVCRINFATLTSGMQIIAVLGKEELSGRTPVQKEVTCNYSSINPSEYTWGKICSHP